LRDQRDRVPNHGIGISRFLGIRVGLYFLRESTFLLPWDKGLKFKYNNGNSKEKIDLSAILEYHLRIR